MPITHPIPPKVKPPAPEPMTDPLSGAPMPAPPEGPAPKPTPEPPPPEPTLGPSLEQKQEQSTAIRSWLKGPHSNIVHPIPQKRPKERIFSGGLVQNLFDAISIPFFFTSGFLQGEMKDTPPEVQKGGPTAYIKYIFSQGVEGVNRRAEWIDFIRTNYPEATKSMVTVRGVKIPYSTVVGTVLNVAIDPSNLIGSGIIRGGGKIIEHLPAVERFLGVKLTPRILRDMLNSPNRIMLGQYRQLYDKMLQDRNVLLNAGNDAYTELSRYPPDIQAIIIKAASAQNKGAQRAVLASLKARSYDPEKIRPLVNSVRNFSTHILADMTDLGFITEAEAERATKAGTNILQQFYRKSGISRRYLMRLAESDPVAARNLKAAFEEGSFGERFPGTQRVGPINAPVGTAERAARGAAGAIDKPPLYPVHQQVVGAELAIEASSKGKFFQSLAAEFGKGEHFPGAKQVPVQAKWGPLAGKWLPKEIAEQLTAWDTFPTKGSRFWMRLTGIWKTYHTVWNPTTHVHNIMGNLLLNDMGLGISPVRLDIYGQALHELLTKGPLWREVNSISDVMHQGFLHGELGRFRNISTVAQQGNTLHDRVMNVVRAIGRKPEELYQLEHEWGKMAAYIWTKKQGKTPQQAAAAAEKWLFNYRKVPTFINNLRSGRFGGFTVPFATFPYKAFPRVVETVIHHPTRISKWYKYTRGVESLNPEGSDPKRELPDFMKNGYWLKLPAKNKNGENLWLDVNFFMPFQHVQYLFTPGMTSHSPIPGLGPLVNLATGFHPFAQLFMDIQRNKSLWTGQPIWDDRDIDRIKQGKIVEYVYNSIVPPWSPGSYKWKEISKAWRQIPDRNGRVETMTQAILATTFGLRTRYENSDDNLISDIRRIEIEIKNIRTRLKTHLADQSLSDEEKDRLIEDTEHLMELKMMEIEDKISPETSP